MTLMGLLTGLLAGLIKTGVEIAMSFVTAIPFTIIWNALIPKYATGVLPERFLHLPFWNVVGALILSCFIGELIARLTPKLVSVSQTNKAD